MIIEKIYLPLQPNFTIHLEGLAAGRTEYSWKADGEFFGGFENSEIQDAGLTVEVSVDKRGRFIGVDASIEGHVTVPCDRCLADLTLPVSTEFHLSVKFGDGQSESAESDDREIVMLPQTDSDLDLAQTIYDYVCLSLPMQRVHPLDECDPQALKYLSFENAGEEMHPQEEVQSPFSALKALLEDK